MIFNLEYLKKIFMFALELEINKRIDSFTQQVGYSLFWMECHTSFLINIKNAQLAPNWCLRSFLFCFYLFFCGIGKGHLN